MHDVTPLWCQVVSSLTPKVTLVLSYMSVLSSPHKPLHHKVSLTVWQFLLEAFPLYLNAPRGLFQRFQQTLLHWLKSQKTCADIWGPFSQFLWPTPGEKLPSQRHSYTLKSMPCLSVLSLSTYTITSRAAGDSVYVINVMLSNSWAIHTSVAPTIQNGNKLTGQYTPVWSQ